MRNLIFSTLVYALVFTVFVVGSSFKSEPLPKVEIVEQVVPNDTTLNVPRLLPKYIKLAKVKRVLARLESGGVDNPYAAVNRYGYLGKYQFSKRTLTRLINLGYLDMTKDELSNFLASPALQERAMNALLIHNKEIIKRYGLYKYIGEKINGITITLEGMLAGAHLVGPYAVKHYVKTGGSLATVNVNGVKVKKFDGNGTSVEHYIKQFSV